MYKKKYILSQQQLSLKIKSIPQFLIELMTSHVWEMEILFLDGTCLVFDDVMKCTEEWTDWEFYWYLFLNNDYFLILCNEDGKSSGVVEETFEDIFRIIWSDCLMVLNFLRRGLEYNQIFLGGPKIFWGFTNFILNFFNSHI